MQSEAGWAAGWITGMEEDRPDICQQAVDTGVAQSFGMRSVSPIDAQRMLDLARLAGGWPRFEEFET